MTVARKRESTAQNFRDWRLLRRERGCTRRGKGRQWASPSILGTDRVSGPGNAERALVAQGIEHRSPKAGVGRSNRLGGTETSEYPVKNPGCPIHKGRRQLKTAGAVSAPPPPRQVLPDPCMRASTFQLHLKLGSDPQITRAPPGRFTLPPVAWERG